MDSLNLDWRLLLAAFAALRTMRDAGGGVVRLAELDRGFEFGGERIPLINRDSRFEADDRLLDTETVRRGRPRRARRREW